MNAPRLNVRAGFVCLCASLLFAPPVAFARPTIGGCPVYPAYHYWNTRIDNLPLHPSSSAWVGSVGNTSRLHADWGNVLADNYGIPYVAVTGSQPAVPINFTDPDLAAESDAGPYPIPPDAPIEGGAASSGDRHVLVTEINNCILYELDEAYPAPGGSSWTVYSAAKFNLRSYALRTVEFTSADAAGLAIFPGLVRYDEVAAGEIAHAIRFTAANIWGVQSGTGAHKYLWPARHWSGNGTNPSNPPMGARFRLKASFDVSTFHPQLQVILRAMKKYGLVLADAGSNWYFQGVSDTNWNDNVFSQLSGIAGSNFEVVDTSFLQIDPNSAQAIQFATTPTNFNFDARSDVLYRNATTGQVYRLFANGAALTGGAMAYVEPNTAWRIVRDADFDNDGVADLLWRNDSTGQVYLMPFASNGMPNGGSIFYTEPNPAWKIVQSPDLDGDGRADLVWWNSSTGQVFAMLMGGATILSQGMVWTEPNTAWKIAATGDFAGTGKQNQLLWRNATTGQLYLMTVTAAGGAFTQTGQMIYQEPNTAWKIVAAADFDGDGKSDILWRNDATGQVFVMLMNGGAIASQAMVYQEANLAWKIVAVGDYNGDGKADLLWRNDATGQVFMMLMNGAAIVSQAMAYVEPNTAWKILGPTEYAQ